MSFPIDLNEEQLKQSAEDLENLEDAMYCWEEQDYEENKYMYEYDLEHLGDLAKREKM